MLSSFLGFINYFSPFFFLFFLVEHYDNSESSESAAHGIIESGSKAIKRPEESWMN